MSCIGMVRVRFGVRIRVRVVTSITITPTTHPEVRIRVRVGVRVRSRGLCRLQSRGCVSKLDTRVLQLYLGLTQLVLQLFLRRLGFG